MENLFDGIDVDPGARPGKARQLTIEGHTEEARTLRNPHCEAGDRAREAGRPVPITYSPQAGRPGYHQKPR